ncbi:MAG: amidohydrolase family protein [Planctomycetes bacterium]|nr:amidohydrolase family protein [Planctomycetota bacterium]
MTALVALHLGAASVLGSLAVPVAAQGTQSPPESSTAGAPLLLTGATVHVGDGRVVERGQVLVDTKRGTITFVGPDLESPPGVERVDCAGKHLWPAMIAANTVVGLTETESVRATRDFEETGDLTPEVRADTAFHPDSTLIPVTRSAGIGYVLAVPSGGLVAGQSALMRLRGWSPSEMVVRAPVGLHVHLPSMLVRARKGSPDAAEKAMKARAERDRRMHAFERLVLDAKDYVRARDADAKTPYDTRLEAMRGVISKATRVFVHADALADIQVALDRTRRLDVAMVLVGGYDAPLVAGELAARDIPVIIAGVHRLPMHRDDPYDAPFTLPARLRGLGVRFCIARAGGSFEAPHERNLPFEAATAVAYGLDAEVAMSAITSEPARILGAGAIGSIEAGKAASLILCSGNPLELTTKVERMWLDGREVSLDNRHEELRRRYESKSRR